MSEEVQELIQKLDSLEEGFRQNRLMTATLAKTAKACLSKAKLTDRLTEARCDLDATIMEAIKAEAVALRQVRAEYSADLESLEQTEYFLKSAGTRYDTLRDEIRQLKSDIDEVKNLLRGKGMKPLSMERFLFSPKDFKLISFCFLAVVLVIGFAGMVRSHRTEFPPNEFSDQGRIVPENMTIIPPSKESSAVDEKSETAPPEETSVPSVKTEPGSIYPVMKSTASHDADAPQEADDSVKRPAPEEFQPQRSAY